MNNNAHLSAHLPQQHVTGHHHQHPFHPHPHHQHLLQQLQQQQQMNGGNDDREGQLSNQDFINLMHYLETMPSEQQARFASTQGLPHFQQGFAQLDFERQQAAAAAAAQQHHGSGGGGGIGSPGSPIHKLPSLSGPSSPSFSPGGFPFGPSSSSSSVAASSSPPSFAQSSGLSSSNSSSSPSSSLSSSGPRIFQLSQSQQQLAAAQAQAQAQMVAARSASSSPSPLQQQRQRSPPSSSSSHHTLHNNSSSGPSSPIESAADEEHSMQGGDEEDEQDDADGSSSPQESPLSMGPAKDDTNESSSALLNEVYQWEQRQKEQLEKIRQYQKQIMLRPQKEGFDILTQQHQQMKSQIEQELKALQSLFQNIILPPSDIHKLIYLLQDLKLQQIQLELYAQELARLTLPPGHSAINKPICALVITEQPMPMVITKSKQLEDDPVVVQLLTGTDVEVQTFSKVKAAIWTENQQLKAACAKAIENDTQNMDAFTKTAKFALKFRNGTRKYPVRLRFGIQLQLHHQGVAQTVTVESNGSRSFIVITNECQWEESEGVLLKKDAFGEQLEVPWAQFANVLQRHFLRATRQDLVRPTRCLSQFDFDYLNRKFFGGQSMVTQKAYDNFWNWFGKVLQKLRYQRHICPLWQTGLIYGFLTREQVHNALLEEEVGTFLIRVSERHPGLFAVGYRTDDPDSDDCVRHYLVKPEDTAGAKKTLPDFLNTCPAFQYLLQVTNEIGTFFFS
ncbi:Signal transducer and activator of transcription, variant 2 [Balamuthia mandrillaris]